MRFFKSPLTLSFLLGALMVLALPPFHITPIFWFTLPAFILLLYKSQTKRRSFFMGWLFGLGYFVFGLYWICVALTTDLKSYWWMMPFALFGLPAYFTIYWGLASLFANHMSRNLFAGSKNRLIALIILLPLFLIGAEWARGHLLTGFPWNLPGYGWVGWLPVLQSVSRIGIYGLTLFTLVAASLPALFWCSSKPKAVIANIIGIGFFVAIGVWGMQRLEQNPTDYNLSVKLRLVQPNIPQNEKWEDATRIRNFNTLLRLSAEQRGDDVKYLVWPETAVPFIISESDVVRNAIRSVVPPSGLVMTGSLRRYEDDTQKIRLSNSLEAINDQGEIIGNYDKSHLVPFGEYMPLRDVIPLPAVAARFSDLTPGSGAATEQWGDLPKLGALICYEVIFPSAVIDRNNKPDWILNVTNDGWYGNTTGPHQHLAMSITRAVEEGLPMVRAANTGISAVIDPVGRVVAQTKLGEQAYLDSHLPRPLKQLR